MAITGSCLCGAVHYELASRPLGAFNCHCSRCRKSRGAAFATNAFMSKDDFTYTRGEENLQSYKPPGAERFTHTFCRTCGSSMPWFNQARNLVVIPMGSIDGDPGFSPGAHIFVDSKAPWFTITDELPKLPGPPGG